VALALHPSIFRTPSAAPEQVIPLRSYRFNCKKK
jgi:hypothetical protein